MSVRTLCVHLTAGIKQLSSTRSRKISSHSLQSDAKFVEEEAAAPALSEDAESVTMMSDETQESPVDRDLEIEDEHLCSSLPWIKVCKYKLVSARYLIFIMEKSSFLIKKKTKCIFIYFNYKMYLLKTY